MEYKYLSTIFNQNMGNVFCSFNHYNNIATGTYTMVK